MTIQTFGLNLGGAGTDLSTQASDLYAAFQAWCEANGERAWSQKVFGMRLTEKRIEREKVAGRFVYLGVGLVEGL